MWAYTDEEIDYLSPAVGKLPQGMSRTGSQSRPTRPALSSADISRFNLPKWVRTWLCRQAARADLDRLDPRTLADLGINRGDFPAILAGTFTRNGQATQSGPRGELASRTLAMPADANPSGAVFGGWVMALMDAAGAMTATRLADGRVVTVSVSNITFLQPVRVGDSVCCYAEVVRTGRTSMTQGVEVWVLREGRGERIKVTHAEFTFVAVNAASKPRPLPRRYPLRASGVWVRAWDPWHQTPTAKPGP